MIMRDSHGKWESSAVSQSKFYNDTYKLANEKGQKIMREALLVSVVPWHALTLECVRCCICHRDDCLKCQFTDHIYQVLSRQVYVF